MHGEVHFDFDKKKKRLFFSINNKSVVINGVGMVYLKLWRTSHFLMHFRIRKEVRLSPHSALGKEALCASLLPGYHIVSAASAITLVREKRKTKIIMWVSGYLPGRGSRRAMTAGLSSGLQLLRQEAHTVWKGFALSWVVLPDASI